MDYGDLIEPDDINVNKIKGDEDKFKDYIKNSILLFNLQTKFNNKIKEGIDSIPENKLTVDIYLLLIKLNNKIDNYIFYSNLFTGIGIIAIGIIAVKYLR